MVQILVIFLEVEPQMYILMLNPSQSGKNILPRQ
jgi:hypothetical protein